MLPQGPHMKQAVQISKEHLLLTGNDLQFSVRSTRRTMEVKAEQETSLERV